MTVGEKIKYRRKVIGITQQRLAELTGIHPVSIRKYETDKMIPGPEQLLKIADALSISYNALTGIDDVGIRLETHGDLTGLIIMLCKQGVLKITGVREENSRIRMDTFRLVFTDRLAKNLSVELKGDEGIKSKNMTDVMLELLSPFALSSLIIWEANNHLYNEAYEKFGNDDDPEIQTMMRDLKTRVEEAELSFQNNNVLLDGGVKINPNY